MNFKPFRDRLVSILVRKRLDLRHVLEVQYGRKGFGFGDRLVGVSIQERKRLDLCPVLEVQYSRKGFGYVDTRERPINLYSVLSSYWNTKY